jgi:hypothetical protein
MTEAERYSEAAGVKSICLAKFRLSNEWLPGVQLSTCKSGADYNKFATQ